MKISQPYSESQIDKLGNALIYLSGKIERASKTHLLKLVFILEEESIRNSGIPFFGFKYNVWKLGPVLTDLYIDLSDTPELFGEYISKVKDGFSYFIPKKEFCDDEFSQADLKLMNQIIDRFAFCTAKELWIYTHKKGSPWYNTAEGLGLLEALEKGKINATPHEIDLSEVIKDDASKSSLYNSYKEFMRISQTLKV